MALTGAVTTPPTAGDAAATSPDAHDTATTAATAADVTGAAGAEPPGPVDDAGAKPADGPERLGDPRYRALTVGLVLTITLVAFEALAVATIMPLVSEDLGGLRLYGWVFSGFFLGNLVSIVVGGRLADRRGLAPPFVVSLVLFTAGLIIGGLAPSMLVLVAGRVVQGLGAGAIPGIAYTAIGRSFPEHLRPRMFAVMSTAWVTPALVGPALSSQVAQHVDWRWVFLGLLPLVALAAAITLPSLARIGPSGTTGSPSRLVDAVRVAVGLGLVVAGFDGSSPALVPVLVVAGAAVALPSLRRLLPQGTLRAAGGLPFTVLARGLLTFAFFGADAFVTLAITDVQGRSVTAGGVALTVATLAWTSGSWIQARTAASWGGRRLVRRGFLLVATGIAGLLLVLVEGVPWVVALPAWGLAGLGMGLAYPTISVTVLREAPPGREGQTTAAMVLSDNIGVALGTGAGGAAVAASERLDWTLATGIALADVIAVGAAVVAIALVARFPNAAAGEDGSGAKPSAGRDAGGDRRPRLQAS